MQAALRAADAGALVRHALDDPGIAIRLRAATAVDVIAAGKAAQTMRDAFVSASLASLRVGWRLIANLELYARVENGFDADYQDVVGYNTAGRTVYAGLRVLLGR